MQGLCLAVWNIAKRQRWQNSHFPGPELVCTKQPEKKGPTGCPNLRGSEDITARPPPSGPSSLPAESQWHALVLLGFLGNAVHKTHSTSPEQGLTIPLPPPSPEQPLLQNSFLKPAPSAPLQFPRWGPKSRLGVKAEPTKRVSCPPGPEAGVGTRTPDTHIVQDVSPALHGYALEHRQDGKQDVVEVGDAKVRSPPVLTALGVTLTLPGRGLLATGEVSHWIYDL